MLNIRKTKPGDIAFIASCLDDRGEDFATQCGYGSRFFRYPVAAGQIADFQKKRGESQFFTILNQDTPIGSFELMLGETEKRCTIARFLIAESHRFQGLGGRTLEHISKYVFAELGYSQLTLSVYAFNQGALSCYLKAGFREISRDIRPNGWVSINMALENPDR